MPVCLGTHTFLPSLPHQIPLTVSCTSARSRKRDLQAHRATPAANRCMTGPTQWKTDAQDARPKPTSQPTGSEGHGGSSANSGKEMWVGACIIPGAQQVVLPSFEIGSSFEAFAVFLMDRVESRPMVRDLGRSRSASQRSSRLGDFSLARLASARTWLTTTTKQCCVAIQQWIND